MSCIATCSSICHTTGTGHCDKALGPSREQPRTVASALPDQLETGPLRNPMNAIAPTRPTELHGCRVRLNTGPAAAAEARRQVRAAICAWDIPVDPDIAILLASELVTNAVRHEPGETVTLAVTCSRGHLRVDVHDTACSLPVLVDAPADAEAGRGRVLHARVPARACRGWRTRPARVTNVGTVSQLIPGASPSPPNGPRIPRCRHLGAMVRKADSLAISIREWTSSFFRMWETWVATVRRDSSSLAAISGLDNPSSTNAAILISVAVRLSQPLRARRCLACGPRRMPWARNVACSRATSAAVSSREASWSSRPRQ